MAQSTTATAGPLTIYRRMQEAVLGDNPTLLPAELLAEDIVVETPFSPPGMRRYDGREAWLAYYRATSAALRVRFERFRELATHQTDDPEVIVVEYELTGTVVSTGVRSSVTCVGVLRVRDGLIRHWREYQDVLAISEALNGRPEDQTDAGTRVR
ncbi:nuclear transport factor 2 family protein [Micromonospora sp. NPDC049559]|uniref:nuclear transport factor 2 family protein n=1 Tax=Micromonospora sp. NPDC049559 TaxID=3155923 RepID=UPI0034331E3B